MTLVKTPTAWLLAALLLGAFGMSSLRPLFAALFPALDSPVFDQDPFPVLLLGHLEIADQLVRRGLLAHHRVAKIGHAPGPTRSFPWRSRDRPSGPRARSQAGQEWRSAGPEAQLQ